jgi:LAO/AO transport system kinase
MNQTTDRHLGRRELGQLLRMLDDEHPQAGERLDALPPAEPTCRIIGVTGNPGAGKSTLVSAMIGVLRAQGHSVAVLVVDPSSPFTGGAVLGDRVRMMSHHADEGVYIRSLATRGHLGGLTRSAGQLIDAVTRNGFDRVIVETVGVGQDEVSVVEAVDLSVVVCVPGLGDSVQSIKAGILEIADLFVVNKADRPGADQLVKELRVAMHLGEAPERGLPAIYSTVATEGRGVVEFIAGIDRWFAEPGRDELLGERRAARWKARLQHTFMRWATERIAEAAGLRRALSDPDLSVSPEALAKRLVDALDNE